MLQTSKNDTLNGSIASGATSATLTTGNFGSPTGTQLLVLDYDNSNLEVINCTITGTALTSITRAVDQTSAVAHSNGAKVIMAFVPSHYGNGLGTIAANDPWTTWTPSWTNLTLGNGTVAAKYFQLGKRVDFRLSLTFGSTTSVSGAVSFSLPVTAVDHGGTSSVHPLAQAQIFDTSAAAQFDSIVKYNSTTIAVVKVKTVSGSNVISTTDTSSTVPMTWATGDELHAQGFFEAA